jgi:flagellar motor switch protein FliG
MLPTALRKAAILISSLDAPAADALLDQMGPEQAAKVRSAMMELDEIPASEEQQVLAEFMQRHSSPALAQALRAGEPDVELDISPAGADVSPPAEPTAQREMPLQFLASAAPDQLARALLAEQPQTIAAVIAHLAPEQTAGVLERLPPELATESLERMASLSPLAPAVLADLEKGLQRRMARQGPPAPGSPADKRVSAVIGAMDFRQRERLLLQLSRRNAALVDRLGLSPATGDLGPAAAYKTAHFRYRLQRSEPSAPKDEAEPPVLGFADVAQLDDESLRAVFAATEPAVVLLALTGAHERLLNRVLRQLPARDAAVLRERIEHPGPVRLREIDQAQEQLAKVASRLAREGAIRLPHSARLQHSVRAQPDAQFAATA